MDEAIEDVRTCLHRVLGAGIASLPPWNSITPFAAI